MSVNHGHDWLMGLHAGYQITEEWLQDHYLPTVRALMGERDRLLAIAEAAIEANSKGFKMTNGSRAHERFENAVWAWSSYSAPGK